MSVIDIIMLVLVIAAIVLGQVLRYQNRKLIELNDTFLEENEELIKEVEALNQQLSIRKSLIDQLQQDVGNATLSQARLAAQLLDLGASHQALWSKHLDTVDELLEMQDRYEPHNLPLVDTPDIPGRHLRLVQNSDVSLS